jgi:protein O-GlcNAc transferase
MNDSKPRSEMQALIRARRLDKALELAIELGTNPAADIETLLVCAQIALHARESALAMSYANRIGALDPNRFDGLLVAANAYRIVGNFPQAESLLEAQSKRFKLAPHHEGRRLQQLGLLALDRGQFHDAVKLLDRASRLRPTDVQILCELGHASELSGNAPAARRLFLRALKLEPDNFLALRNAAAAELNIGRVEAAYSYADTARKIDSRSAELASGWLLAATSLPTIDAERLRDFHLEYAEQFEDASETRVAEFKTPADKPVLRIGYFSHHFRQFPLSSFVPHVMRAHDRSRFRVYAFSVGGMPDASTREYVDAVDEFFDLSTMSDAAAAAKIREQGIDVLIDLSGYTLGNRFSILRLRPAAIQCSWLGYLTTTGARAMDYHITDSAANPRGATEHLFSEKLIRLPYSQYTYRPVLQTEVDQGTAFERSGFVTFGMFTAATKLNADALCVFAEVLSRCPKSRIKMLALSKDAQDVIAEIFNRFGVARSRIEFFGKKSLADYFRALSDVDIVLDSFPYVGGTVVCDTLWMGVPTVSMWLPRGFGGASRSILSAVGLADLVAADRNGYIDLAVQLANDTARLKHLKSTLRGVMLASPLMQTTRFARALEFALCIAWKRRLAGLPPQHIDAPHPDSPTTVVN